MWHVSNDVMVQIMLPYLVPNVASTFHRFSKDLLFWFTLIHASWQEHILLPCSSLQHASMPVLPVSTDGVTDVTAQCCSAAVLQGDHQHKCSGSSTSKLFTTNPGPGPGPGLVTRLQTVTAANFTAAADPSLQIQSGRKPEQPSYLCLSWPLI